VKDNRVRVIYSDVHDQLHPLPLASAARFRIRHAYPVSFVIEANGCGYAQGPFWLPWRFALVGQGNRIEDVRFLFSSFSPSTTPPLWPPKREYNTVSAERSIKFSNIVWVETSRYLIKITILRDREGSCSQAHGFATITMYS
jgi:hypothetical protein